MSKGRSGTTTACAPHGHTGVERDPAGVAAHDLDDEDALVGLGGRLQPVEGLGGDGDGRVEAEGDVGGGDVVVDGLRDPDDRQARLGEEVRRLEGALAADRDDGVEAQVRDVAAGGLDAADQVRGLDPGGAEDGAAAGEYAAHRVEVELAVVTLQQALPPVVEADDLVTVVDDGAVHDGTDDGIQTGAVSAGGEHTNAHSPKTFATWADSRTTSSGWIPATLSVQGGGAETDVRTVDTVRSYEPVTGARGCVRRAAWPPRCARRAARRTTGRRSAAARSRRGPASGGGPRSAGSGP